MSLVWVELGLDALPVRIFRNKKASLAAGWRQQYVRVDAVRIIRHKLFLRSQGECEFCGAWVFEDGGHMHERQHRGKGGEVSLVNSVFICPKCHQHAHADRSPRWAKKDLTSSRDSGSILSDNPLQ